MVLNVHINIRLIRDGEKGGMGGGGGGGGGREREIIYLSLHCYHQNDSCIKTGSEYKTVKTLYGRIGLAATRCSQNCRVKG